MRRYLTADGIYIENSIRYHTPTVLVFQDDLLIAIEPQEDIDPLLIEYFEGVLVPGFVNAHCHLELSHMKGVIAKGTGLVEFLLSVIGQRLVEESQILDAILAADKEMYENGIVAVGDISNKSDSFNAKTQSKIKYHTFIECIGMNRERAQYYIEQPRIMAAMLDSLNLSYSFAPHAPYSVSEELLDIIYNAENKRNNTTIHFQETKAELELFEKNQGDFNKFYDALKLPYFMNQRQNKNEVDFVLHRYNQASPYIFVHNTFSDLHTLQYLNQKLGAMLYLCTCPKANLYIENRLPDYELWLNVLGQDNICIGTDSLASNENLNIYEEMLATQESNSTLSADLLLQWATINGAHALGLSSLFGSFNVGKKPGAVIIPNPADKRLIKGASTRIC